MREKITDEIEKVRNLLNNISPNQWDKLLSISKELDQLIVKYHNLNRRIQTKQPKEKYNTKK